MRIITGVVLFIAGAVIAVWSDPGLDQKHPNAGWLLVAGLMIFASIGVLLFGRRREE
jgi:LPXTG-motif cell wall-anchored protein